MTVSEMRRRCKSQFTWILLHSSLLAGVGLEHPFPGSRGNSLFLVHPQPAQQSLLCFEVPWLYVVSFSLCCEMHMSIACVMCNAAVSGTGLFSTESPVSPPLLCRAVHTDTIGLQCCSSHTRLQLALLQIIPGGSCQLRGGRVKAVWVCILILHFLFFRSFEFCCTVWKV